MNDQEDSQEEIYKRLRGYTFDEVNGEIDKALIIKKVESLGDYERLRNEILQRCGWTQSEYLLGLINESKKFARR